VKEEEHRQISAKDVPSSGEVISLDVPFPTFFSNPILIFIALILVLFFVESFVMLILELLNSFDILQEMLIDSSLLTLILSPILFFFFLRPMQSLVTDRKKVENALIESRNNLEETVNRLKAVEEKLRAYNVELGELVKQRTTELQVVNNKLRQEIENRNETERELLSKIDDLEKFYDMSVGRELKMKELAAENEKLKSELSQYKK
jgi:hypothetical protein